MFKKDENWIQLLKIAIIFSVKALRTNKTFQQEIT